MIALFASDFTSKIRTHRYPFALTATKYLNMSVEQTELRSKFIQDALQAGALKFGEFTLKSKRISPYFFNAGLLCTGPLLSSLAESYAALIAAEFTHNSEPTFDVLYGPAYKGIPLAAATALTLFSPPPNSSRPSISTSFAYNRKESKDHGEGGTLVGASLAGKRVLVLDDVITAGTAVREALDAVRSAGGIVVGVVIALDREEVPPGGTGSTMDDVEAEIVQRAGAWQGQGVEIVGVPKVRAAVRMRDLVVWLEAQGRMEDVAKMKAYREQYGVKE
ncbi:Uridine 5'-monophosphate synthase/orotate phosphoribosyltransferase [Ceratobasidium theobromae]|uniref:orotate phosphoribosyltransferase n=1 Tax=Ceratobasidium theobromae TaxID=1582974 RepID=A0A5N5QFK7_9AGAM|nr:Uridine 5'-monophosphate synthase/orotate phosphoribosyltransferase [Ceratobasidium theobromae]